MIFEEALKIVKRGGEVTRVSWIRKGTTFLMNVRSDALDKVFESNPRFSNCLVNSLLAKVSFSHDGTGDIELGWTPSYKDQIAEDWIKYYAEDHEKNWINKDD